MKDTADCDLGNFESFSEVFFDLISSYIQEGGFQNLDDGFTKDAKSYTAWLSIIVSSDV